MLAVLAAGIIVFFVAAGNIPFERVDVYFLLLFCFTIGLGSRVTVPIPQLKSHIAVSDIFIFLALLLFGGPLAIVLSAVEAFLSSWRFCNKKITVLFNASSAAISTAAVVVVLGSIGFYSTSQVDRNPAEYQNFLIALSVMAVVYFAVNTLLAAVYDSLTENIPVWNIWKGKYLWTFITFFAGAAGAGLLVQLSDWLGFGVIVAALPIILLVYGSYRMYLTTVRMSIEQAEQAEEYAKRLEDQAVALRESEERFRTAFTHAPIGIALVASDGRWMKVNRALCDNLGYSEEELLSRSFESVTHPEDLADALGSIRDVLTGISSSCQIEQRYLHSSGKTVWTSVNVSSTDDIHTTNTNFVFQILDITEKKIAEERLLHEASHDSLTGLPNRSHFMKRLDAALVKSQTGPEYRVSVLFIDLDRFKYVNDSLGHFIGDELLCTIAQRLTSSMRPPDLVARLGGDEFVVLVEGQYNSDEITRIAERIQKNISAPFKLQGHEVFTSASIGILNAGEQHRTSEDIVRDADTAMYHAKRSGKARYEIFDRGMRDAVKETLLIETDLRRAIHSDELEIWYQPILSLKDGRIYSLEALARWQHPDIGVISPDKFIPLAEEIGLIDALGERVLRTACLQMSEFRRDRPDLGNMRLSVNLSCKQFANTNLIEQLGKILDETNFPANRLKLEITETIFFEYHDRAVEMLHELRAMGVETDIDDFGTGYSNLGYLVRLPISTLKIDRSFVMMMSENLANREVIRTVMSLAANLGLRVVAEGIETAEQRETLLEMGCDFGQGYLFAKPMNAEQTLAYLRNGSEIQYQASTITDVPELATIQ